MKREQYRQRLSGPLADRIDLRIELEPVTPDTLLAGGAAESSDEVRKRVQHARVRQQGRLPPGVTCNAELPGEDLPKLVDATPSAVRTLQTWMERTAQSARVGGRVLKVARTIADLESAPRVENHHIRRAASLRCDVDDERSGE